MNTRKELARPRAGPFTMGVSKARKARRVLCGVAAAALVIGHTLALAGGAVNRMIAGPQYNAFDRVAGDFLTATGTIQRWHMFSPGVGDASFAPVVLLTIDDPGAPGGHRKVIVNSPTTPPMLTLSDDRYFKHDLTAEERRMVWAGHFGDARRRKLDTRIIDPVAGEWEQGTSYARWVLDRYMHQNPEVAPHIRKVDLFVAVVTHYGQPQLPVREACYLVRIYPQTDPRWPMGITTSVLVDPPASTQRVYQ